MKVVVILPTYNERENIGTLLDKLRLCAKKVHNHRLSYLVVDDNSPDGTGDVVSAYQKNHPDVEMIVAPKEGLGKALLRGMTYAVTKMDADIILQIDADLSHDPVAIPQFLSAIDKGADFVVGSRYIAGGAIPDNWGLHRKIYSIAGNAFVRFGLGYPAVHDWTGGYRAYRKKYYELAKDEVSKYSGYVFQIAFLYRSIQNRAKVCEVPIVFTDRMFGHSKISPPEYIRNILTYVGSERWKRIKQSHFGKFLVVGTIGFIINTVGLEVFVRLGTHPAIGSALGAELAIISNFILNNNWTFKERKATGAKQFAKFLQFNTTSLGAIIIQAVTVAIGTYFFGIPTYRTFYILGVLIGLFWNYTMYSKVIWKQ